MTNEVARAEPASSVAVAITAAESELVRAAESGDAQGLKAIHDQADALQRLVGEAAKRSKALGGQLKKLNDIARVRITAAREMGKLLHELVRQGGPRYRGRTLDELGISRNQSSKWQRLGKMPDMVPAYIESCNNRMEEASVAGYMRFAKSEPHFSSESDEWYTPSHIIEVCVEVLGGIDLNPCSNRGEPNVPAKRHFTVDDDGLAHEWAGSVFMNPPYGRALPRWVRKLRREIDAGRVTKAIALLPARPGSDWFEEAAVGQVCFLRGRLRFSGGGPAPFPSMCTYLGRLQANLAELFSPLGPIFTRH